MIEVSVNYWAVLVCSIIGIIIGGLWYGPIFGKTWIRLMGFSKKDIAAGMKKNMTPSYISMFLALLITNYILAHFVYYLNSTNFLSSLGLAFAIWLGFYATTMLGSILWEGKSFKLYLINIFHYLIALIVSSYILSIWV